MPERPLLLFPSPETADRTNLPSSAGRLHKPNHASQSGRLSPMFDQLQATFNSRRAELLQNAAGVEPEQVLVIETVGSIENFANAMKRIEGLEWMGELESDEIAPDEYFYDESNRDKNLGGRLYLVMTNQRALLQMLSLWRRYQTDQNMPFERGLTKFRDVFLQLRTIRRWDVQDRLLETGLIESWREDLEYSGDRVIPFETELWFRGSAEHRLASTNQVTTLVQQLGGHILSESIIESIGYHGLLAELPANAIRSIVEDPTIDLVKCENIMFFRPVGQMLVDKVPLEGDAESTDMEETPLPTGHPIIALFDGIPLANHKFLAGRVQIDDPDNWETDYTANERLHGTSMASLIIHGDLNEESVPLARPIYVRPIMKPIPWHETPRPEGVPENHLVVDLIHRCVRRLFEEDQGNAPAAPTIKVINLSIGDRCRQFDYAMSPLARLLDWLSLKYGILFIVSAGNHSSSITFNISRSEYEALQPRELESLTIKELYREARNRKLLSPAESINSITVGAVHYDTSEVTHLGDRFSPFEQVLPSTISAFGGGYRRAIKPDFIFNGGKQLYRLQLGSMEVTTIEPAIFRITPGNKSAIPGNIAGQLDATGYSCGTSNATALISRAAGICYESLRQILNEHATGMDTHLYEIPLLKAMLVHSCTWGEVGPRISAILSTPQNSRQIGGLVNKWLGYGIPQINRVLDCTDQRATLMGFGQLSDGDAHVFRLPLPTSLSSRSEWRRLTVTLAWLSPIAASTHKYRTAGLWFEVGGVSLAKDRKQSCSGSEGWRAVRRGTVQHEIFEGQSAEPFTDDNFIEVKVNCREDAGKIQEPIAYGIVVSLEVSEGVDISVYNEIRTRIVTTIRVEQ